MKHPLCTLPLLPILLSFLLGCQPSPTAPSFDDPLKSLPPDERYGELFVAVQMGEIFPDSKTFVDCEPKRPTAEILDAYTAQKDRPDFDLAAFVERHFELPRQYASGFKSDPDRSLQEHINALWPVLTRGPDEGTNGTLIPLPHPYVVPGGRFGEVYYWDSYFTMLGLKEAGKLELIEHMLDNFAYLLDTLGYIPNGNRTYYLGRSQPPFFAAMVNLLAEAKDRDAVLQKYLPALEKEYNFWMDGFGLLNDARPAYRRVVRLPDGTILNRYWDDRPQPRPESYREDIRTAEKSERPAPEVYRNLRAACESGWDFSSRWLGDSLTLESIRTTELLPVCLNSLMYNLEMTLAHAYEAAGKDQQGQRILNRAFQRKAAMHKYFWDATQGFFTDYDWVNQRKSRRLSLAGLYPLYFRIAVEPQIGPIAEKIRALFLQPGGLVTTPLSSGQQWDAPNGWAPLQWIGIQGLRHYGETELAQSIKQRWVALNRKVYRETGKLVEKYNVMDLNLQGGGGEYPVQDGFGWTNGVLLRLLSEVPAPTAPKEKEELLEPVTK